MRSTDGIRKDAREAVKAMVAAGRTHPMKEGVLVDEFVRAETRRAGSGRGHLEGLVFPAGTFNPAGAKVAESPSAEAHLVETEYSAAVAHIARRDGITFGDAIAKVAQERPELAARLKASRCATSINRSSLLVDKSQ